MTAMSAALLQAHRANLNRYCQLLSTDLTPGERRDLHRRISETQNAIEEIELSDLSRECGVSHMTGLAAASAANHAQV